jgi:hypothetical protein
MGMGIEPCLSPAEGRWPMSQPDCHGTARLEGMRMSNLAVDIGNAQKINISGKHLRVCRFKFLVYHRGSKCKDGRSMVILGTRESFQYLVSSYSRTLFLDLCWHFCSGFITNSRARWLLSRPRLRLGLFAVLIVVIRLLGRLHV